MDAVKNIHHVHIWQLNDKELHFEAHIEFKEDIPITCFQKHLLEIEEILAKFEIHHINIQPEFEHCKNDDLIHNY
jgi:cobalt-zinc-cadmium efflux system protein